MLNLKNLTAPCSLIFFSIHTFILPLAFYTNVDPANANQSEAIQTCIDLRKLIKDLSVGSPSRNFIESKYANFRCHRYLHNKADGRNCEEFIKAAGGQLSLNNEPSYSIGEIYKKGCIITEDDDGE